MDRVIILGSGSASGVPTISEGWGCCNPHNPRNIRRRSGIFVEIGMAKIQIDTSQDFRCQMIDNKISDIDGVLYTHAHADHISGIDDLRSITWFKHKSLDVYAIKEHLAEIKKRFSYVFADVKLEEITQRPQLIENIIEYYKSFNIKGVDIVPLAFTGHSVPTSGYVFNNGKLVVIPDYRELPAQTLEYLQKIHVDVMIMPLTDIREQAYHAGIETDRKYIDIIKPQKVIFTHLSKYCDYDEIIKLSQQGACPAFDNMVIEL